MNPGRSLLRSSAVGRGVRQHQPRLLPGSSSSAGSPRFKLKSPVETADTLPMSFIADMLVGRQIAAVLSDSEVTYLMMADGTQVTVRGLVVVEPPRKVVRDEPGSRTHTA